MNALLEPETVPSQPENRVNEARKILLVDDDPGIRQMLSRLLTSEDYIVVSAANGFEAIELAKNMKPDLVLLDLNMPGKDGWDTYEQLTSKKPVLPVIVITARPNQYMPAKFAGVGALMEKPVDLPALLETIRELLSEPMETRLARLIGKPTEFHYVPPKSEKSKTDKAFQ